LKYETDVTGFQISMKTSIEGQQKPPGLRLEVAVRILTKIPSLSLVTTPDLFFSTKQAVQCKLTLDSRTREKRRKVVVIKIIIKDQNYGLISIKKGQKFIKEKRGNKARISFLQQLTECLRQETASSLILMQ